MAETGEKPKHKPSQKHTLDEVLRSLQDMIRHELKETPADTSAGTTVETRKKRADMRVDLESALEALKADIEESLMSSSGAAPFEAIEARPPVSAKPIPVKEKRPAPTRAPRAGAADAIPPPPPFSPRKEMPALDDDPPAARAARPNVRELPFLDDVLPDDAPPAAEAEQPPARRPELSEISPPPQETEPPVEPKLSDAEEIAKEAALLADSIPVLTEAVDWPDELLEEGETSQLEVQLPSADRARDIAIQVAARLNIEMRNAGRRGLNTQVIIRLAQLLRDALARAQTNMDNSDHKP